MDQNNVLIETLRRENYCLMTDEDGLEIYDDQGNLLVCKSKSKTPYTESYILNKA